MNRSTEFEEVGEFGHPYVEYPAIYLKVLRKMLQKLRWNLSIVHPTYEAGVVLWKWCFLDPTMLILILLIRPGAHKLNTSPL